MNRFKEEVISHLSHYIEMADGEVDLIELVGGNLVVDATKKFIVINNKKKLGFVHLASPLDGMAVKRAYERAKCFSDKIGQPYDAHVSLPFFLGEFDGLSYSISTCHKPISTKKLLCFIQRRYVWGALQTWINGVASKTRYLPSDLECSEMFKDNLQALLIAPNIKYMHKEIIEKALFDLDDLKWKPELVCSHNDLWLGNVMLNSESRFIVIDWDGSIERGYPFYDLIRALGSFRLSHNQTKKAIEQYCDVMQCDHEQAKYYLLSAFAYLYQNLGAWPYQRLLDTLDTSLDLLISHQ